jgi:hypothetical protein
MPQSSPTFSIAAVSHVSRLRMVQRAVGWVSLAIVAMCVAALAGTALHLDHLTRPFPYFRPMPISATLGIMGSAIALWTLVTGRQRPASIIAAVSLAYSVAGLLLFLLDAFDFSTRVSLASLLLLTTASLAIFVASVRGSDQLGQLLFGICGFVSLALAITSIGARAIGAFGGASDRTMIGASAQTLIAGAAFGCCFLALVWARGLTTEEPPTWVPAAVGIATLIAVLFLWRALAARDLDQAEAQLALAAETERQLLAGVIDPSARSLTRAAEREAAGSTDEELRRDLTALVRDLRGMTGGVYITAAGVARVTVPGQLDPAMIGAVRQALTGPRAALDTLAIIPLDDHEAHIAIVAPICTGGRCAGAIAGLFDATALFAKAKRSNNRLHVVAMSHGGLVIGADSLDVPVDALRQDSQVRFGSVSWTMSVFPSNLARARRRSNLPSTVLFMGLLVAALLPLTLSFGQRAWRGARETERGRLAMALERSTDGIWEWDIPTGYSSRSANLWQRLDYDPARMPPEFNAWLALIHPDDRGVVELALNNHLDGSVATFESEYRVRHRSGDWHLIVDRGRVVDRRPDGTPSRMLGISADVTESRKLEDARDRSDRRFRAAFESGFQQKFLLDADGTVREVNRGALDQERIAASAVVGQPLWDALEWAEEPEAARRLKYAIASAAGGTIQQFEHEVESAQRGRVILELAVKPVHYSAESPPQLLLEVRDITARRRAEAAFREVDTLAAMGRIAARVAHEINNPLAGIQYSFLLIKDAVPADHPHFTYVGAIEREIARIATVTRQLYETYRPEQEHSEDAALGTVIGDAVAFLLQVNRASQVSVETDLSGAPGVVRVSGAVLRQIVYNLVQNAMDASPVDGVVRVSAVVSGSMLELRVSDSGPGVPAKLREQIFQPFFSTKDARSRTSGMGLGLSLVKRTVQSAGGRVRVDDGPNGGAEFIVELPLPNLKEN